MDFPYFQQAFLSAGIRNLTPSDAYDACLQGAILMDVREKYLTDYKVFDVPHFLLCPLTRFDEWKDQVPKGMGIIVADATGLRSREAILRLMEQRDWPLVNLAGGLVDWERKKLPVRTSIQERLRGSCMCQLRPRDRRKS